MVVASSWTTKQAFHNDRSAEEHNEHGHLEAAPRTRWRATKNWKRSRLNCHAKRKRPYTVTTRRENFVTPYQRLSCGLPISFISYP